MPLQLVAHDGDTQKQEDDDLVDVAVENKAGDFSDDLGEYVNLKKKIHGC